MEIWKEISGADGYFVSSEGRVRHGERMLKPVDRGVGYYSVSIIRENKRKKCYVHRLVAEAFIPNPNKYRTVNHKDGNKANNTLENLEWLSHSANEKHSYLNGRRPSSGYPTPVTYFGEYLTLTFDSQTSAARFLDRSVFAVYQALKRGSKCAGGRIEYA